VANPLQSHLGRARRKPPVDIYKPLVNHELRPLTSNIP
jgi:hypothetical protein